MRSLLFALAGVLIAMACAGCEYRFKTDEGDSRYEPPTFFQDDRDPILRDDNGWRGRG